MNLIVGIKEQSYQAAAEEGFGSISSNFDGWKTSVLSSLCKTTFVQRVQSAMKPICIHLTEKKEINLLMRIHEYPSNTIKSDPPLTIFMKKGNIWPSWPGVRLMLEN